MGRLPRSRALLGATLLLLLLFVLAATAAETANSASANVDGSSGAKDKRSDVENPAEASQAPEPEVTLAAATESDDGHSAKKSPTSAAPVADKADEATSNKHDDGDALSEKQKQLDAADKADDGNQKGADKAGAQPDVPKPPPLSSKKPIPGDAKSDTDLAEGEEPKQNVAPVTEDDAPASPRAPSPPQKDSHVDESPIDENTYRYVEPQMSKEMKIFQLSMYAIVVCIVLTLAHKGLDAAGLDQAFFLKFVDGPSKIHLVLRGVVRAVAFLSWVVAVCMLYAFSCITNRCGRRERAAAPLVPPPVPTVGTFSVSSTGKPKKGLGGGAIKSTAASQGGWNDTWSDDDMGRK